MSREKKSGEEDTAPRLIYSKTYTVRSYETDVNMQASLSALIRYMQESAWRHADTLGVGYDQLISDDLAWVLIRLSIHVERYPKMGETVTLHTWPSAKNGLLYMRDFEFRSEKGEVLAKAVTGWLVMDIVKRRPVAASLLKNLHASAYKRALSKDPDKLPKLDPLTTIYGNAHEYTVQYTDLDVNRHVNNTRFIDIIINGHPLSVLEKKHIRSFEITYIAEAVVNDRLVVYTKNENDGSILHSLIRLSDHGEICRARLHLIDL